MTALRHYFDWRDSLTIVLFATLLAGCGKERDSLPLTAAQLPVAEIQTVQVQEASSKDEERIPGTVRAVHHARIEPKINSRIESIKAEIGQQVKEGELLVGFDANELRARFDQARAASEQAARDLRRYSNLVNESAVTRSEFEAVRARAEIADAALAEAKTMLDYTAIVAPFSGVITEKLANVGDMGSPGRAVLELEDPSALRFEVNVPETLITKVSKDQNLPVVVSGIQAPLIGQVSEISPAADPVTRTFLIKLNLPNDAELHSGVFGQLLLPTNGSKNLWIPTSALVRRGQMELVFVVEKDEAIMRLVRTGELSPDRIEILAGLNAGDTIVKADAEKLRDGQKLKILP